MKKKKDPVIILLIIVVVMCAVTASKIVIKHVAHAKDDPISRYFVTAGDKIKDGTVDISQFDELDLDVSSIDTYIQTGDSYKLEYHAYEYNIPEVEQRGGELTVKQPSHSGIFNLHIVNEEQYYKLTVPENAGMLNVDLEASSGRISVENVDLEGKATLSSGNLILTNSKGDDLTIHISSGNANIENISFSKLKMELLSGNLNINGGTLDELETEMSSGNMDLSGMSFNQGEFKSSSGNLNLEVVGSADDFSYDLKSSSGSIIVDGKKMEKKYRTEDDKDKTIKAELSSGKINISFTK